jgi:hypothetical protein
MLKHHHPIGILALFLLALIQTPAHSCEPEQSSIPAIYLSVESPVRQKSGRQVGRGTHSYRFVVRDPQRIEHPYRNARYQVALKGEAVFPDGNHFYRGITDDLGRTSVFRFTEAVSLTEWFVQPLVGKGEFGGGFHLGSDGDCPVDLDDFPYMVNFESGPIFCGRTLPGGYTPRFMSRDVESVQLNTDLSAVDCRRLAKRLNPVMALSIASQRIVGLEQLRRDRDLSNRADFLELIQRKIDIQVLRHGSLRQVKALLERRLAELEKASPKKQADVYNSLGYDLLTQKTPRHRAYASQLLDKSLSLNENLFNMDSKAWYLHLTGQDTAALELMNRAMPLYGVKCTESERAAYSEALAHHGMVLWSLGRRLEALNDWAQADLVTTDGGWVNFIPSWKYLGPVIMERSAQMRADGLVPTMCSEIQPDEIDKGPEIDKDR